MNNKYEDAEIRGRRVLCNLLMDTSNRTFNVSEITFTEPTARYDGDFVLDGAECVFEMKYRQNSINKYDTYLFEKAKYDELERHYLNGKKVYYIMLFLEEDNTNSAIVFNISERINRWGLNPTGVFKPSYQPNSTVENRGRSEKLVTFLVPEKYDLRFDTIDTTRIYTFSESGYTYD